ncbi:MAG TPA: peptidoglycan DD-metalloendopeptidase family protein [Rhodanobacteraceae bacterium]|nr:peptidoglycan DD-metalloendopeptidase family protein [Rhodanobacteraceae bacterium]
MRIALASGAAALAVAGNAAPPAPASAPTSARATAARSALAGVRARIAAITAAQQTTAAKRQAIDAQLATQAQQLDAAAHAARATDAAIAAQAEALAGLQQRYAELDAGLAKQRAALAALLRAAYTLDRGSDLTLLLGDEDVARVDRALAYSGYFQRDRVRQIRALETRVAKLDALRVSIDTEMATLQQQRAQGSADQAKLESARDAQQKLLAAANAQLAAQQDQLAQLQRDAAALGQLLKRLQNVFADIPAQLGQAPAFTQLRGKLPLPVAGTIGAHADPAQGIVITAKPGTDVRAVAYGRVAYASFMRGFGMLVIVDHGNGWMSLYGGNEALLVQVGDWVKPGQAIATVARNSEQGGAWFGLRHDGTPVDPRGWFAR